MTCTLSNLKFSSKLTHIFSLSWCNYRVKIKPFTRLLFLSMKSNLFYLMTTLKKQLEMGIVTETRAVLGQSTSGNNLPVVRL